MTSGLLSAAVRDVVDGRLLAVVTLDVDVASDEEDTMRLDSVVDNDDSLLHRASSARW